MPNKHLFDGSADHRLKGLHAVALYKQGRVVFKLMEVLIVCLVLLDFLADRSFYCLTW